MAGIVTPLPPIPLFAFVWGAFEILFGATIDVHSISRPAVAATIPDHGDRIRSCFEQQVREGRALTRDLGGTAGTTAFTDELVARLKG